MIQCFFGQYNKLEQRVRLTRALEQQHILSWKTPK